ncbi:MAG: prepilin-type N-terminal cleavage/methylation domain-containing protein [Lentisphaerae bacterium]|nr:MAG: prepilin-type N-terminal cleavage/methylation domain-containing protein [Lentisphaerota bacterium]
MALRHPDAPIFRGFTLIELLVVISIIAILAALLLPVLTRARGSAKQVVCINNGRQVTMSWLLYTDTYDGWFPMTGGYAYANSLRTLRSTGFLSDSPADQLAHRGILICPQDDNLFIDQDWIGNNQTIHATSYKIIHGIAWNIQHLGGNWGLRMNQIPYLKWPWTGVLSAYPFLIETGNDDMFYVDGTNSVGWRRIVRWFWNDMFFPGYTRLSTPHRELNGKHTMLFTDGHVISTQVYYDAAKLYWKE